MKMIIQSMHYTQYISFTNTFVIKYFTNIGFIRYVDDLATIYHPERKSILHSIKGFSISIECLGGEVPFFYLSGKYKK